MKKDQSHSCHCVHRGRLSLDNCHCLWYDLFKSRLGAAAVSDFLVGQRRSLLPSRGFTSPLFPTFSPSQFKHRTSSPCLSDCLITMSFIPFCLRATQTVYDVYLYTMFFRHNGHHLPCTFL